MDETWRVMMAAMVWQRACLPRLRCDDCFMERSDSPVLSLYFPGILAAFHGSKVPINQGWGGILPAHMTMVVDSLLDPAGRWTCAPQYSSPYSEPTPLPSKRHTHTYIHTHARTNTDACVHDLLLLCTAKPMQRQSSPPSDHLLHRCHDNCKRLPM